ncbi:hypothetical protein LP419_34940 [Massilia sp. H-1]|nr:hypothetical protein LP419_34940 [Massilia sp. H-1]
MYADVVSPYKEVIIPRTAANELGTATSFVADARAAGLKVHTWTLRPGKPLPAGQPAQAGRHVALAARRRRLSAEIAAYLKVSIDGFFTDDPAVGRAAVAAFK